jgi:tetratricopeptide (TPR) repeat protein
MLVCTVTLFNDANPPYAATDTAMEATINNLYLRRENITDFAQARNDALAYAAEGVPHHGSHRHSWAIMLDTDERLVWRGGIERAVTERGVGLYDVLAATTADVIMTRHVSGTYEKERIFRLPARGHYHGRTHEAFIMDEGAKRITTDILAFDEIAKTPEQYRAKVERDVPLLQQMIGEDPDDPRWWYYLGDTCAGLGRQACALDAFERCWSFNGWDEESAWAAYRVAEIRSTQNEFDLAIEWCCKGMQRHPGMAELPWLAGFCCFQLGQHQRAIWWAAMAEALNKADADGYRVGFRYPPALYEGPYDIMRYCYRALGQGSLADLAEACFQERYDERTSREKIARS